MIIQQLFKKFELPDYFLNLAKFNLLFVFILSVFIMVYSDGQSTIKLLNDKCYSTGVYYTTFLNMSLVPDSLDHNYIILNRYYNDNIRMVNFIKKFNYYFYVLVIPLFNIVYCLIIIFDGTIIPPKDLYTLMLSKFRGVKK